MNWILVFIVISGGEVKSTIAGSYQSIYECFETREQLAVTAGGKNGYYPPNMQAICVKTESSERPNL